MREGDGSGMPRDRRQTAAMVGLLLAAVAVVGLLIGALVGAVGGGRETEAAARTGSPEPVAGGQPDASPSVASAPRGVRPTSEVERGRTTDFGYFLFARLAGDTYVVSFDRAQLFLGSAAVAEARRRGTRPVGPPGSESLVVNENPKTRDVVLAPDVRVLGTTRLAGTGTPTQVSLSKLLAALPGEGARLPLDLRYDAKGEVVEITERATG